MDGAVSLTWGDGEHVFSVAKLGVIRELQAKTGVGPLRLYRNLIDGEWKVDDAREVIRLGLIGGGMAPAEALALVAIYFDDPERRVPWMESAQVAQAVMLIAIVGHPEDKIDAPEGSKKKKDRASKTKTGDIASL